MAERNIALFDLDGNLADYDKATYQLGFDILEACVNLGFDIHILTQGPLKNLTAWNEKVEWVDEHVMSVVPEAQIIITRDKSRMYGKVLVNDYSQYVRKWLGHRPRGLGVMPANNHNQDFVHPSVIKYDGDNLDEVVSRLETAHKRIKGMHLK
ncbi:hypothetical protein GOV03_05185 [Candidatus Woesearchaeota archaeon]|nr:hypothetical protein [Candidatus Woesearchaeota archaeon]